MHTIHEAQSRHILGVPGIASEVAARQSDGIIGYQTWVSEPRKIEGWGPGAELKVEIRFDDSCKNGRKSFSITGTIRSRRSIEGAGCIHDEIAATFPELAELIRWHLMDEDGPLHYVANTLYHASDKDHRGKRLGEPYMWEYGVQFGGVPITHMIKQKFWLWLQAFGPNSDFDFEIIDLSKRERSSVTGRDMTYSGFTFGGYPDATDWHTCPFKSEREAFEFLEALKGHDATFVKFPIAWSEGKARDLDAARAAAKWPDAPHELLTGPQDALVEALQARLPGLLAEFREAMVEVCGFTWAAPEKSDA